MPHDFISFQGILMVLSLRALPLQSLILLCGIVEHQLKMVSLIEDLVFFSCGKGYIKVMDHSGIGKCLKLYGLAVALHQIASREHSHTILSMY